MAREDDFESADLARERELEWQQIVENFGERAVLEPEDEPTFEPRSEPTSEPAAEPEDDLAEPPAEPADEFVPPTPPPVPRPPIDRLIAWSGVFGVPTFVLVCIVFGITLPPWTGLLLAAGFIGGFGYLVMRMSDEPRDPWDDGAVL
jgi:hypothetical protein